MARVRPRAISGTACAALLLSVLAAGCGDSPTEPGSVILAHVRVDEQPVSGATVTVDGGGVSLERVTEDGTVGFEVPRGATYTVTLEDPPAGASFDDLIVSVPIESTGNSVYLVFFLGSQSASGFLGLAEQRR
ncbi:MAG: hypothetical protein ACRENI_04050 [Gemmatimonadaceae bacterium]